MKNFADPDEEDTEPVSIIFTMALLCKEIDPEGTEEIRDIYKEVRARAEGAYRPTPIVTLVLRSQYQILPVGN